MSEAQTQPSPFHLFVEEDAENVCTVAYLVPTDDPQNQDKRIMLCTAFSPLVHPVLCPPGHAAFVTFVEAMANETHKALLGGEVGHVEHREIITADGKPVTLN